MKWFRVAEAASLPPGTGRTVHANRRDFALFHLAGGFCAMEDTCPHRGGPLGAGHFEDGKVFCPLHGWIFEVETGACLTRPDRPVKTFPVQVVDGEVHIGLED